MHSNFRIPFSNSFPISKRKVKKQTSSAYKYTTLSIFHPSMIHPSPLCSLLLLLLLFEELAMASSSKTMKKKLVNLKTFEGDIFQVESRVASQSQTIKSMMNEGYEDTEFPIPNVKKNILQIILVYCEKHVNDRLTKKQIEAGKMKEDLTEWDSEYINQFITNMLYHLLLAANYLEIKGLLDLIVTRVVNLMRGKMPEQIRETFGIKNDFPPGMEEEIRNENPWAFEIPEIDKPESVRMAEKMKRLEIEAKEKAEAAAASEASASASVE